MAYMEGTKESRLGEATSGSDMLKVVTVRTQFILQRYGKKGNGEEE